MQYKENDDVDSWKTLRINNNRVLPPINGWTSATEYHCVINKFAYNYCLNDNDLKKTSLCRTYEKDGFCMDQVKNECNLIHGDLCDICDQYSLHPFNEKEREQHLKNCIEFYDNVCAICLDNLHGKLCGALNNCNHIYCLECIKSWHEYSKKNCDYILCPKCRIKFDNIKPFYIKNENDSTISNIN